MAGGSDADSGQPGTSGSGGGRQQQLPARRLVLDSVHYQGLPAVGKQALDEQQLDDADEGESTAGALHAGQLQGHGPTELLAVQWSVPGGRGWLWRHPAAIFDAAAPSSAPAGFKSRLKRVVVDLQQPSGSCTGLHISTIWDAYLELPGLNDTFIGKPYR